MVRTKSHFIRTKIFFYFYLGYNGCLADHPATIEERRLSPYQAFIFAARWTSCQLLIPLSIRSPYVEGKSHISRQQRRMRSNMTFIDNSYAFDILESFFFAKLFSIGFFAKMEKTVTKPCKQTESR